MSDTTVAAPAATTEAPATTVDAPKGNTPGEVKQSGRANARAMGEKFAAARQAEHHAQTQPRAEDGKFVPVEAASAAPAGQVLDGSATVEATASPQAAQPPEGMVRIELGEGHPLADQGETYLDVPKDQERKWRTAVNAAARRADVEKAETRARDAEAARLRVEAELKFVRERGSEFWTAEHQATYDDLLRAYGQDAADAYKRGQQQKQEGAVAEVRQQAELQAVAARWNEEGQRFKSAAHSELPKQFPGLQPHEVETAITMYAHELSRAQNEAWELSKHTMSRIEFERRFADKVGYTDSDFFAVTTDYLKTRPGVIAASGQQSAAQTLRENQIRAEAEAAERERLKDAGKRHAKNPHRALGGVTSANRSTDTTPAEMDRTKMTPEQIKRAGRDAARQLGEAFDRGLRR